MEFIFSENTVVEDIEKVPNDFRGLYQQGEGDHEGKYVLRSSDEVKSAVAAITGLSTALKAARAEAKNAKGKAVDLSPLSEFGESPDEIRAAVDQRLTEAAAAAKKDGDKALEERIEKIKADLAAGFSKEREGFEKRNTALLGQLEQVMFRHAAMSESRELGVKDPELFMTVLQPSIKTGEEEGQFVVQVVDEAGDVRYSGVTGKPMTIKERIQEMKSQERYAPFFRSEAPKGGGTPPGAPARTPPSGGEVKNPTQKIAAGLAAGQYSRPG